MGEYHKQNSKSKKPNSKECILYNSIYVKFNHGMVPEIWGVGTLGKMQGRGQEGTSEVLVMLYLQKHGW